jgi:hypothetical protein
VGSDTKDLDLLGLFKFKMSRRFIDQKALTLTPDRFILKFEDILEIGPNAFAKVISSNACGFEDIVVATCGSDIDANSGPFAIILLQLAHTRRDRHSSACPTCIALPSAALHAVKIMGFSLVDGFYIGKCSDGLGFGGRFEPMRMGVTKSLRSF